MNTSASKKKLRKVSLTRQASAQSLGRKKAQLLDLGLPKIEQISYMHLKAQQQASGNHDECKEQAGQAQGSQVRSSKAFLELQRKVSKLEA